MPLGPTGLSPEGPLHQAALQFLNGGGAPPVESEAWDGEAETPTTVLSVLQAIYAQNVTIIGHLATIAANTTPNEE